MSYDCQVLERALIQVTSRSEMNCKHTILLKALTMVCANCPKYGKDGYVKKYHFLCELLSYAMYAEQALVQEQASTWLSA